MRLRIGFLLALALVFPFPASATAQHGVAARYRPGLMQRVARNRGIEPAACMVASPSAPLRSWVHVSGRRTNKELRCLVVDVPQDRHRARLARLRIVVELDHESARVICGSVVDPPRLCPVTVRDA